MYEQYYGFREKPFNLTPDPTFLYLSEKHKEAFAHLLYGIRNRSGFIMVTGEIGTGKTTICRSLLSRLDPETEIAFIFNPILSAEELLRTINQDFGIDSKGATVKDLIDELNAYLLQRAAEGKNCVLVIDEAQNLDPKVLEQVRLLSNLETETQKLLQIVLIGQPELAQMLATRELRQLNQRITARYHLKELDAEETLHYIAFRIRVAGGRRKVRFSRSAVIKVYKYSKGTPRVVNAVCDRALLIGYTRETREITPSIIKQAVKEVRGEKIKVNKQRERRPVLQPAWASTMTLLITGAFLFFVASNVTVAPRQAAAPSLQPAVVAPMSEPRVVEAAPVALPEPKPTEAAEIEAFLEEPDALDSAEAVAEALDGVSADEAQWAALGSLTELWGRDRPETVPAAGSWYELKAFASANGFAYERRNVTLEEIFAINLPAYLTLDVGGSSRPAALIARDEDYVELACRESGTVRLTPEVFEALYGGQAAFLWVDPQPGARHALPWQTGDHVRTIQQQLKRIGLTAREATGQFDADTIDLIRKLQEATGLDVDGVVGAQTRMVLTSWDATVESPSLCEPALPEIAIARLFGLLLDSAGTAEATGPAANPVREAKAPAPEPVVQPAAEPVAEPEPAAAPVEERVAEQARTAVPPEVAEAEQRIEVEALELEPPMAPLLEPDATRPMKLVTPPAASHVPLVPGSSTGNAGR